MPTPSRLEALQQQIREAKTIAARLPASTRDRVLSALREGLLLQEEKILQANRADLEVSCCVYLTGLRIRHGVYVLVLLRLLQ